MPALRHAVLLLFSLSVTQTIASDNRTAQACNYLHTVLPDQIAFPGSQAYENSIASYAYAELRVRPACLASPASTANVSVIIQTLGKFSSVPFAIRSGGHNTNKGFSNVQDGITIDLSAINAVQVQMPSDTVSIGTGARWQSVYDALDPYGLAVQGGRNGGVGVGGLITGGGIGFFSPLLGSVCDSVRNFEVVLAGGKIVNANQLTYPDLYTALKGGSNNFGVVTRVDMAVFKQGPLWGGVVSYTNASDLELLNTFTTFKDPKNFDPNAMITFGFTYDAAHGLFASDSALYYSKPDIVQGSTLAPFAQIQPQTYNSIRNATLGNLTRERLYEIDAPVYMHWATLTFKTNPTVLTRIHDEFRRVSLALTDQYGPANLSIAFSLQSVPAAPPTTDPNSLGFGPNSHPERDLVNLGIGFQYGDAAATDGLEQAVKESMGNVNTIIEEEGASNKYIYLNYAGSWQDVFAGYGSKSLTSLRQVAKKYDSQGMFQKQVKGGFKLF